MVLGPQPVPVAADEATVLDDVTNGYVPWSTSKEYPGHLQTKSFYLLTYIHLFFSKLVGNTLKFLGLFLKIFF